MNLLSLSRASATPTMDTDAYGTGDFAGTVQELQTGASKGDSVILRNVKILDLAKQSADFDLLFYSADPTVTSADNAAIDINDDDQIGFQGYVSVGSAYVALADNSVHCTSGLSLHMKPSQLDGHVGKIWVVAVIRDTATYAATSLTFTYEFEIHRG